MKTTYQIKRMLGQILETLEPRFKGTDSKPQPNQLPPQKLSCPVFKMGTIGKLLAHKAAEKM